MGKVIRLTESDLIRIVKKVIQEQTTGVNPKVDPNWLKQNGWVVVKDNGKIVQSTYVKNGIAGAVDERDYDYIILHPKTNKTFACQTMNTAGGRPSCYSDNKETNGNVSKTEDIAKAKKNVGLA